VPTLFRYAYRSTDVYTLTGTLDHGTPRITLTEPAPNSD